MEVREDEGRQVFLRVRRQKIPNCCPSTSLPFPLSLPPPRHGQSPHLKSFHMIHAKLCLFHSPPGSASTRLVYPRVFSRRPLLPSPTHTFKYICTSSSHLIIPLSSSTYTPPQIYITTVTTTPQLLLQSTSTLHLSHHTFHPLIPSSTFNSF